ncbi:ankyrin repeat domain-containing protein [Massilia sp. CMS3.1]|uniref:ankyrin repeat domain-containing protein n=1 Tax=Massilia sp. CMS3.1 TaxID=3373083 RepID=UPI003EE4D1CC
MSLDTNTAVEPRSKTPRLTPLMEACALGHVRTVVRLLAAGADLFSAEPHMGATALHKGAQSGNPAVVRLLLDHGAFIDQQSPVVGNTALMDAVLHKHVDVVRLLLERGARTFCRDHLGQTALHLARIDGLERIVQLIEARDRDDADRVKAQGLMAAVRAGDGAAVRQLLAASAAVDERAPRTGAPEDDCTPLGLAARTGRDDIVRSLLDAGADPRQVNGAMRATAGHEAAYFGHAEVLRTLTRASQGGNAPVLDIGAQGDYNGFTALHDAAWHGHFEAARALVEAGARLDLTSHAGLTPRELAYLYGYGDLAAFLAAATNTSTPS